MDITQSFIRLQQFLQHNGKNLDHNMLHVKCIFVNGDKQIAFEGRMRVDLDSQRTGGHFELFDCPKNFEHQYHSEFRTQYNAMIFDEASNELIVHGVSTKTGRYGITVSLKGRT